MQFGLYMGGIVMLINSQFITDNGPGAPLTVSYGLSCNSFKVINDTVPCCTA